MEGDIFTGSRNEDMDIFGGRYSAGCTILRTPPFLAPSLLPGALSSSSLDTAGATEFQFGVLVGSGAGKISPSTKQPPSSSDHAGGSGGASQKAG